MCQLVGEENRLHRKLQQLCHYQTHDEAHNQNPERSRYPKEASLRLWRISLQRQQAYQCRHTQQEPQPQRECTYLQGG